MLLRGLAELVGTALDAGSGDAEARRNIAQRLHVLLEVLAELREASWQLDIVGSLDMDRRYVRRIRAQIENLALDSRISLHGTLDGEHLAERYRGAQMLVVPSSYEGFMSHCLTLPLRSPDNSHFPLGWKNVL